MTRKVEEAAEGNRAARFTRDEPDRDTLCDRANINNPLAGREGVAANSHSSRVIEPVRNTMPLDPDELRLFYKLYPSLLCFVNQRQGVTSTPFDVPEHFGRLPIEERLKLRDALVADIQLIDAFVSENPFELSQDELEVIRSWKDLVAGEFYVYRCLTKYTVFLTAGEPVVAYGVLSLVDSFEDLVGHRLPHLCQAVLLPFKGRIVYDGMLAGYNVRFGSGIRRRLKESYDAAKQRQGIVTSIAMLASIFYPIVTFSYVKPKRPSTSGFVENLLPFCPWRTKATGASSWLWIALQGARCHSPNG